MKKIASYTLGCKVNQYETEALVGSLSALGYEVVDYSQYADVYLINTCTVTSLADRKCRQVIRKAKKQNPDAIVVAMGCYAQVASAEVAAIEDVNIVIGTHDRNQLPALLASPELTKDTKWIRVGNIMQVREFEELGIETYTEHTRAFLKIQDGCNRFCSYCIIPFARGPVRSRAPQKVLSEIQTLTEKGYREFVLTGIHLASYGAELEDMDLVKIIEEIAAIPGVERIRLGSIEPMTITPRFLELVRRTPKLCPHYHISLQSGCDTVLKRMNRKYTTEKYYAGCQALKEILPDVSFTTDIIVGFPGETEEEFLQTLAFAEKVGFSKIHVFPYSPRKGTVAAKMENQVEPSVKEERTKRLIAKSDALGREYAKKMIGKQLQVLIERKTADGLYYEGYAENYARVYCPVEANMPDVCGKVCCITVNNIFPEKQQEGLLGVLHL